MALLEEGPVHYAAWKHLPDLVREGKTDGLRREFGVGLFDYLARDGHYADIFSNAMSGYSAAEAAAIRAVLAGKLTGTLLFCDIGGGFGYLLAALLEDRPSATGIILDLPTVVADKAQHVARTAELADRCTYVAGDMFESVPEADIYVMKHIIHDWTDDECTTFLSVTRRAARPGSRLMIFEWVIPTGGGSDFSKLVDIHMMCISTGRQQSAREFDDLLSSAGWQMEGVSAIPDSPLSLVEARPA